jgi:hypothetical protein
LSPALDEVSEKQVKKNEGERFSPRSHAPGVQWTYHMSLISLDIAAA